MQSTFTHLIKRSLDIKQTTVGDPFEVLPVKNSKNAKNCTEIHLADRGLQELINFDKFPNLECLWLNNNKVSIHLYSSISCESLKKLKGWTPISV